MGDFRRTPPPAPRALPPAQGAPPPAPRVHPSAASFRALSALSFDHPYLPTKLQFHPRAASPPLLASNSDALRLYLTPLDDLSSLAPAAPELRFVLDNRKASNVVVVLDIRAPRVPVAELHRHRGYVNAVAWAPQATRHLYSAGDDGQALIWELPETVAAVPTEGIDLVLVYDAGAEVNQLQWAAAHLDWMGIAIENKVQLLRV